MLVEVADLNAADRIAIAAYLASLKRGTDSAEGNVQ